MTAYGASRPLLSVPARVSYLITLEAFKPGGGDYSSCPEADLAGGIRNRMGGEQIFSSPATKIPPWAWTGLGGGSVAPDDAPKAISAQTRWAILYFRYTMKV
jgi:hypothetical protein